MVFQTLNNRFFARHKISRQLFTIYIFAILLPVLVLGTSLSVYTYQRQMKSYEYLTVSDATRVRSVLLSTTIYFHDIYDSLSSNRDLSSLVAADYASREDAVTAMRAYSGFDEDLANNTCLSGIRLYVQPGSFAGASDSQYFYQADDAVQQTDWYQTAASTRSCFWRSSSHTDTKNNTYTELTCYFHVPIPENGSFAVLVMTVSNNYLQSMISGSDYKICISVNDSPSFYATDRYLIGQDFPAAFEAGNARYSYQGILQYQDARCVASVLSMTPYQSSDVIHIMAADTQALHQIRQVAVSFVLIILFVLLLSFLTIFLFTRYFSSRIQTLRLAMHQASENDFDILDTVQGDDELSATFQDLKRTVARIRDTDARLYEAQIREQHFANQQQQMELKLLSNQINPHFLYNTLEMIRMKAFSEGCRDVATAIKLLGKSMRYVLNTTRSTCTTLDKEIDYTKVYLSIQQMRFGNRLRFLFQIPEDLNLSQYEILPLMLQPIVENAISHGIEASGEDRTILIRLRRKGDSLLLIHIFDNGCGMDAETLRLVRQHIEKPDPTSEHGIGLYNINNRIHLFYGPAYGLSVKSVLHTGTLVTMTLPLRNLSDETFLPGGETHERTDR